MTNEDLDRQELIRLHKLLIEHFSLEELHVLCFYMGLSYEELSGDTRTAKMLNLITYLQRRDELQKLLDEVRRQRPNVDWPDFTPTTEDVSVSIGADTEIDAYTDEKTGLEMIHIPAGVFSYGEENQPEYLPKFWISKTPVTNLHYLRFVEATEHNPPEHWERNSPKAEIADCPVVLVSWYDAKAYTDWAGMHLPTEKEWEKAARGTDGRIYPWGNEWIGGCCNTEEAGIGTTTPVGRYSPQGDSPYGCVDMAGNVWEWTASWYDHKEVSRVLRGGSWLFNQFFARAAYRNLNHPNFRNLDLGFRVVVRRPPSE